MTVKNIDGAGQTNTIHFHDEYNSLDEMAKDYTSRLGNIVNLETKKNGIVIRYKNPTHTYMAEISL